MLCWTVNVEASVVATSPLLLDRQTYFFGVRVMQMSNIPFGTTDWSKIEPTQHKGETGSATWRTQTFGGIRVHRVDYTPDYRADHWCVKGHILFVLEGELVTELEDGLEFVMTAGQSYQVADNAKPHRSRTATGAKLFIVD
jgi:hypothetical protein